MNRPLGVFMFGLDKFCTNRFGQPVVVTKFVESIDQRKVGNLEKQRMVFPDPGI